VQNLLEPLKMYDTGFYVPREKIDRYTTTYTVYNVRPPPAAASGGPLA
jgi:CubicO group peptidase (beta-lactamase class C family)